MDNYYITEARYIEGYKIELTFENGKKGIVDFTDYPSRNGIFSEFSDIEYFKKFYVNEEFGGVLCWPNGQDIAPETIYRKATGEPLPGWMQQEAPEAVAGKAI